MPETDTFGSPTKAPDMELRGYEVYVYESDSGIVPDVHVVERPGGVDSPHMRQWVAVGKGPFAALYHYEEHQYGPDDDPDDASDCCSGYRGDDLTNDLVPEEVRDIVMRVTDAPMVSRNE